jgi:hypothetical protein
MLRSAIVESNETLSSLIHLVTEIMQGILVVKVGGMLRRLKGAAPIRKMV